MTCVVIHPKIIYHKVFIKPLLKIPDPLSRLSSPPVPVTGQNPPSSSSFRHTRCLYRWRTELLSRNDAATPLFETLLAT
ncbi:hypothetical protein GQ457_02G010570 [Hibiscus cannabinus]